MRRLSRVRALVVATLVCSLGGWTGGTPAYACGEKVAAGGLTLSSHCRGRFLEIYWRTVSAGRTINHWNLRYGQRLGSRVPVFPSQRHLRHVRGTGGNAESQVEEFPTLPLAKTGNNYAFFSVQSCSVISCPALCVRRGRLR